MHLDPSNASLFALFDRMRRKRNEAFYDIAVIGEEEAEDAVVAVEKYLRVITAEILKTVP